MQGKEMNGLTEELRQLRDGDPYMRLVLDTFEEIEQVYRESLETMGISSQEISEVKNSADVTISFRPSASTSS